MKKTIRTLITAALIAGSVSVFADKLPKKEYVKVPAGRSITMQPSINHLGHAYGTVAIDFVIDKNGNVISATADRRHTTVRDRVFIHKVEEAVMAMKFNKDRHARNEERGSLAYSFR
ncbi:hypothetical protein [Mucilaginibacter sp. UR6-11]|uniref:hypothetical protein n=1 Tax=Mucilaginibacter sp. UR6-11 TaxID=1435644 RepID=UPI001E2E6E8C|nr:hypothetical protein [Mucilaginibacter sp. UR6-11]MCC8425253.1 hypothetical protein [Mucilaginibacter sp. UR6-11]